MGKDSTMERMSINYKYNEQELISQFKEYVDKTYEQHYSKDKFQATEFIMDGGHGEGFCIGNILKYAQRPTERRMDTIVQTYSKSFTTDSLLYIITIRM